MQPEDRIAVYIDEAGHPSQSPKSSRHFVLSAVMVRKSRLHEAEAWLAAARKATNRQAHHVLHFTNFSPDHRMLMAKMLGSQTWGRFISVIVCKDHLPLAAHLNDDGAYLYALRFLVERISWFARQHSMEADLHIAHKIRFKREKLLEYEARLQGDSTCQIKWDRIDLGKAILDQPKRLEMLQVADSVASSTAASFELDDQGLAQPQYVLHYLGNIYRGPYPRSRVTSYGLKMHPWPSTTKAAYPWVAAL